MNPFRTLPDTNTNFCESFRFQFQRGLLKGISKRLGWDAKPGEKHLDTLLRSLVLGCLSWLEDADTIAEARKRFAKHVETGASLPADLRSACYKTVLRAGGSDEYNTMLNLYRSADLHEEKDRISRALGAAKDPQLLKKVLEFSVSVSAHRNVGGWLFYSTLKL